MVYVVCWEQGDDDDLLINYGWGIEKYFFSRIEAERYIIHELDCYYGGFKSHCGVYYLDYDLGRHYFIEEVEKGI